MKVRCVLLAVFGLHALRAAAMPETYVLQFPVSSDADIATLSELGLVVDHFHGHHAELFVSREEYEMLQAWGLPVTLLEIQGGAQPKQANTGQGLGTYVSHATMTGMLQQYATLYPDLCRLESVGTSVQGRELWTMLISNDPSVRQTKPRFKYIATMHGDEPIGTVLLLYLIDELLSEYGTDARLTAIVDSMELWLMPLMNPDGYEAVTRNNANAVDLNRSFPVFGTQYTDTLFDGAPLLTAGRPPETISVMEWTVSQTFALSGNFHSGALVMNYPYDHTPGIPSGTYAPAPDDALLIELALAYASSNAAMAANNFFPGGITNGSDWFAITGGMQDWNYRYAGCINMTIALNNTKRPAENTLPGFWTANRESMLRYMEAVHRGVRGLVTDARTGAPVFARIRVAGNTQPVFSDPELGDYYRLLLPGSYTLVCEAPDYFSMTAENVTVTAGLVTELDFALMPIPLYDLNDDGVLDAQDLQLIINAVLGIIQLEGADLNEDGVVDAVDIQLIVNALLA